MKISSRFVTALFFSLALSGITGCSNTTTSPKANPLGTGDSFYHYELRVQNLRHVEPSERLILWVKKNGDTSWIKADTLLASRYGYYDSLIYTGILSSNLDPNSIARAMVSVEPNTSVSTPSAKLIAGDFNSFSNTADLRPDDVDGIGDYTLADASVTFATKSSDTNRSKYEFYLMRLVGGKPLPSTQNLKIPNSGWVYSLWVTDSNFFPAHQFYYGSFTNPNGPDSDSTNDSFPFPGGYNAARLTDPGATLSLQLMPAFSVAGKHQLLPSPFVVLATQLQRFINNGQTLNLQNVSLIGIPTGQLVLIK